MSRSLLARQRSAISPGLARQVCGAFMLLAVTTAITHADTPPAPPTVSTDVEIRRTTDDIPHVRAANWQALGVGIGYAQAQDALCTLAEAFVTYEGRRSWFFGADARPTRDSTLSQPKNIDLDFFFRAFADEQMLNRYRQEPTRELHQLVAGFTAGYNRYLTQARQRKDTDSTRACLREPWVREITVDDIYRRMYAAQIAGGYARFIPQITNAQPAQTTDVAAVDGDASLHTLFAHSIGTLSGIGSNVLAFGREATGEEGAVLFGNPHWYWSGPDRFYQMHLTIPGQLDVAGVAFLGIPVIFIGFNNDVAWSHTVSAARRFGLFALTLDPHNPTRYQIDGRTESMTAHTIHVDIRDKDGTARQQTRTLYRTLFGPVVTLGERNADFAWGKAHALAFRDGNADNFRIFRNFFYWNQARSLEEFRTIQYREAAVPWVNTVAIGRGNGQVWYADVGTIPNVSDQLRSSCQTPLTQRFARVDPQTPVLDGSRSTCNWPVDPSAAQPGAMAAKALPALLRPDYVANMNDSYWLTNVRQPLQGFPSLLGGERQPLSLRGRFGHQLALDLLQGGAPSAEVLSQQVMQTVLTPRSYSAEQFKADLLARACTKPTVEWVAAADISSACKVLAQWSNDADTHARGALLWDAWWARLSKLPAADLYAQPFASNAPLDTPRGLRISDKQAVHSLAETVLEFQRKGWPLDSEVGSQRYVPRGHHRLPLYGGCDALGYFTIACSRGEGAQFGPNGMANSYLQVVRFDATGVQAYTLLAHGQDEAAVTGGARQAPIERYIRKAWLHFPFRETEIASDPQLQRTVLSP